ncbi:MAG: type II toxin-antitoxin system HicA family toxin [Deltaproteobacteria bacterium]|nr:type II toxin-antitoxin system HicA family toxin [Deltaproteobacteria bacterium]
MKSVSGKELAKLLEKKGWEMKRIHGSHHVYTKPGNPARISVPIHKNVPLKIGLLKHFMKIAEIGEEEL